MTDQVKPGVGSGLITFIIGLVSAGLCLLVFQALLNVLVAPIGLIQGYYTYQKEKKAGANHSVLNALGIIMCSVGLAFAAYIVFIVIQKS